MKKVWFLLPVLAVFGLASCGKSWTWHQKTTVTIATPEGVKAGSSVTRATLIDHDSRFAPPEARGASATLSGEAVVIEVVPGKYLFALLKNLPDMSQLFYPGEAPVKVAPRLEATREPVTVMLKPKQYPMLVTFADIKDPTSVQLVDPADLAETFGPGVSLKSITIATTQEPITEGKVESLLTWLSRYPEPSLGPARGETKNIPFYNFVHHGDFIHKRR